MKFINQLTTADIMLNSAKGTPMPTVSITEASQVLKEALDDPNASINDPESELYAHTSNATSFGRLLTRLWRGDCPIIMSHSPLSILKYNVKTDQLVIKDIVSGESINIDECGVMDIRSEIARKVVDLIHQHTCNYNHYVYTLSHDSTLEDFSRYGISEVTEETLDHVYTYLRLNSMCGIVQLIKTPTSTTLVLWMTEFVLYKSGEYEISYTGKYDYSDGEDATVALSNFKHRSSDAIAELLNAFNNVRELSSH